MVDRVCFLGAPFNFFDSSSPSMIKVDDRGEKNGGGPQNNNSLVELAHHLKRHTALNTAPPAVRSKMAIRGPQNGRQVSWVKLFELVRSCSSNIVKLSYII